MKDGDPRDPSTIAVSSLIERGLDILGHPASPEQVAQLAALAALLSEWAIRINLTGHRDLSSIATRLVLDAAALSRVLLAELRAAETLADLGSGAGFPGLPLAILHPHLSVRLVESRLKRTHFQRAARRQLGLTAVEPIAGRSDRVEIRPSDVVVAQAMTRPEAALELMRPWARAGGLLVLPASAQADPPRMPGGLEPFELRTYTVPLSGVERKLWLVRIDVTQD